MDSVSDQELIEKFRRGQIQAFNVLTWRWQDRLLNFLYRYLGNAAEAEDICQTTFLKAFQKLKHLQDTQKFSVWLYQIALNQVRDYFRKKKRQPVLSFNQTLGNESNDSFETVLADDSEPPDYDLQQKEMQKILSQSLQKISEDQRAVIIMKIFENLKFSEIAVILKIPEGTAKSRLYTGLKSLRTVLKRSHLGEEVWKS